MCARARVCVCDGAEGLKRRQRRSTARSLPLASRQSAPRPFWRFLPPSSSYSLLAPFFSLLLFLYTRLLQKFLLPSIDSSIFLLILSWYYTPSSPGLLMELYIKVLCVHVDTVGSSILIIRWTTAQRSAACNQSEPQQRKSLLSTSRPGGMFEVSYCRFSCSLRSLPSVLVFFSSDIRVEGLSVVALFIIPTERNGHTHTHTHNWCSIYRIKAVVPGGAPPVRQVKPFVFVCESSLSLPLSGIE